MPSYSSYSLADLLQSNSRREKQGIMPFTKRVIFILFFIGFSLIGVWYMTYMPGKSYQGRYAAKSREQNENIIAMFSIESIGYYSEEKNSQSYPALLGFFYPDKGNFIGFVGNLTSRELVKQAIGCFRKNVQFPSEGIAAPSIISGVSWSDHRSFWKHGYQAIMVTDTVPYRNPHYHLASDTPDTLDYGRMARVTTGLLSILLEQANSTFL